MNKWIVWGSCQSWVVLKVDGFGRTQWRSKWFTSQDQAERHAETLRQRAAPVPARPYPARAGNLALAIR